MSLDVITTDVAAVLSRVLDGSKVMHLVWCGNKQLNRTLKSSHLSLQFDVDHVGFLAVPDVFVSIANLFPAIYSLVLLGWDHTGVPIRTPVPNLDVSKLKSVSIGAKFCGFIGTGVFARAVMSCFADLESGLDDLFPNAEVWFAGQLFERFARIPHAHDACDPSLIRSETLLSLIPKSAISISLCNRSLSKSKLPDYFLPAATIPAHLMLPNFLMPISYLEMPQFKHLLVLNARFRESFSMSLLPRTLLSFEVSEDYSMAILVNPRQITMVDAPPLLNRLVVFGHNNLVIKEPLPSTLTILATRTFVDSDHLVNAAKLPKGLRFLETSQVFTAYWLPPKTITAHLFVGVETNSWKSVWPTRMEIRGTRINGDHGSFLSPLLEHLKDSSLDASFMYTLERALVVARSSLAFDALVTDTALIEHNLKSTSYLHLTDAHVLKILHRLLQVNDVSENDMLTSIVTVLIQDQSITEEMEFVLANIHRLCPNATTLDFTGELDTLSIPHWVTELELNHVVETHDGAELPIEEFADVMIGGLELDLTTESLPDAIFSLPAQLQSLRLYLPDTHWDKLVNQMDRFLKCLPRNLQYLVMENDFHLQPLVVYPTDWVESIPANMRHLSLGICSTPHSHLHTFCERVAKIPSLNRLVVSFSYPIQHTTKVEMRSVHCFSVARDLLVK